MKKWIMITAILLLSVWAVLATITAVDNENRRSRLYDERAELQEECERQERAYEKLETKYTELEAKCEEYREKYLDANANYTLHLAYEWIFDMVANQGNANYNAEAALDKICEREELGLYSKLAISQKAQQILQEYGYETE